LEASTYSGTDNKFQAALLQAQQTQHFQQSNQLSANTSIASSKQLL
jgi:dual specificity tyrosine-phosphorylation-regulated kinase 2/3/4